MITHLQVALLVLPLALCQWLEVQFWIHLMSAPRFELSSLPPEENWQLDYQLKIS